MPELGQGAADITPPVGAVMDGFGARPGPATRILDRLSVRALCFRSRGRSFAVLSFDLIGVRGPLLEAVRRALTEEAGLQPDGFMIAATHTHAGPVGGVLQDLPVDDGYIGMVSRGAVAAVRAAQADRALVDLDVLGGRITFPVNRRLRRDGEVRLEANTEAVVDRDVRVLRAFRKDGSLKAAITHASCHALTLPGSNTAISADYPALLYTRVDREFSGALPVFLLGSAGDVNPTVLPGETPEQTRERCGGELAAVVTTLLGQPRAAPTAPSVGEAFAWDQATIDVPVVCPLTPRELEERVRDFRQKIETANTAFDRYSASRHANWYAERFREAELGQPRSSVKVTLQVFMPRPDLLFVALPFEVFTSTSQDLLSSIEQQGLSRRNVFITSCANEIHSYLPPASALREGGYECEEAPVWYGLPGWYAVGAEALVRQTVVRLAQGLLQRDRAGRT